MKHAYALLGLTFIIVFGSAYLLFEQAEAPAEPASSTTSVETATEVIPNEMSLQLSSTAFANGESVPDEYTCEGENINPPLAISGVPEGTVSLVLVMDDPDIPEAVKDSRGIEKFDHWVLYNLPPDTTEIPAASEVGSVGNNSRGEAAYTGPCPPTEYEPTTHRYIFRLYALTGSLNFIKAPTLDEVEAAAEGMMLEKAELTGLYTRVTPERI